MASPGNDENDRIYFEKVRFCKVFLNLILYATLIVTDRDENYVLNAQTKTFQLRVRSGLEVIVFFMLSSAQLSTKSI